MFITALILSILSGLSIVFARIFNGKMAEKMGLFQGAFINNLTGLALSIAITLATKQYLILSRNTFANIPLWAYLGGILGIGVVVLSSYLTKRISVFYLTLLIFLGQLVTGIIIDYFVTGEISIGKSLGGVLVVLGFVYNLKIDQKQEIIIDSRNVA